MTVRRAVLASVFALAAAGLHLLDTGRTYRLLTAGLYLASLIPILTLAKRPSRDPLALLLALAAFVLHVVLARRFPFIPGADELRDSGLNVGRVLQVQQHSYFDYTAYNAQGSLYILFVLPFHFLITHSILSYRLCAAIIGAADVWLLFEVLLARWGRRTAFWAAAVLAVIPHHLYFSRTQPLVIFTSFFSTAILGAALAFRRSSGLARFALLGVIAGVSSDFHASVRVLGLAVSVALLLWEFALPRVTRREALIGWVVWAGSFMIGWGPLIFQTSREIFFQSGKESPLVASITGAHSVSELFAAVGAVQAPYLRSVMAVGYEPLRMMLSADIPVLPALLFLVAVIGFSLLVTNRRYGGDGLFVASIIMLIPLTHSALTGAPNLDYRVVVWHPFLAFAASAGITGFLLRGKRARGSRVAILAAYLVWTGAAFIVRDTGSKRNTVPEYLTMHLIDTIAADGIPAQPICIEARPEIAEHFELMHVREMLEFLLPGFTIGQRAVEGHPQDGVTVRSSCGNDESNLVTVTIPCQTMPAYICPNSFRRPLFVRIEATLLPRPR